MAMPFDHIDIKNHETLTSYAVGQFQRKVVWDYLLKITNELEGYEILELNAGSGDDAILFGDKDLSIVATDLSGEASKIIGEKNSAAMQTKISSHYLDLENINETLFNKKFDLIFSNFGGLNSMSPETAQILLNRITSLLKPGGRMITLAMPQFCMWESVYYLYKGQFNKIFRRRITCEVANDKNQATRTWFYTTKQIKSWTKGKFKIINVLPVGIALPPLSLERLFTTRKQLLFKLNRIDQKLQKVPAFASISDSFLIDLRLI